MAKTNVNAEFVLLRPGCDPAVFDLWMSLYLKCFLTEGCVKHTQTHVSTFEFKAVFDENLNITKKAKAKKKKKNTSGLIHIVVT